MKKVSYKNLNNVVCFIVNKKLKNCYTKNLLSKKVFFLSRLFSELDTSGDMFIKI